MIELVAPHAPLPDTAPNDPRIGHLLGRALRRGDPPRVVIVGFPSDEGVRRNGGRPGAAEGPAAIRAALVRLAPDARDAQACGRFTRLIECTLDLGDLRVTGDVERDQAALGELLAPYFQSGTFVLVLGGGHETTYGHFLGSAGAGRAVTLVNWDAHADVREPKDGRAHSGSPFRQALEHSSGLCQGYVVAGLQPQSVSRAHVEYLASRGAVALWRDELAPDVVDGVYGALRGPALVSFDLDAVDGASAPGVSAPSTGGIGAELWLRAAHAAGRSPLVGSCDVVELAPPYDQDGRTARLAALTVWHVLRGLAGREE